MSQTCSLRSILRIRQLEVFPFETKGINLIPLEPVLRFRTVRGWGKADRLVRGLAQVYSSE